MKNKKSSIHRRLLRSILLTFLIISGIGGTFIYKNISEDFHSQLLNNGQTLTNAISNIIETTSDPLTLQRHINALGAEPQVNSIIVVSATSNNIIASTKNSITGSMLDSLEDKEKKKFIFKALSTSKFFNEHYFKNDELNIIQSLHISDSIINSGQLGHAVTFVSLDMKPTQNIIANEALYMFIWVIVFFALIALSIFYILKHTVLNAIDNIILTMQSRKEGNTSDYADIYYNDEIGFLAKTLNQLLDSTDKAHKETQQAVIDAKNSHQRYEALVDSAIDAIITIDQNYKIVLFNVSAEKIFGYSEKDILGRDLNILIPKHFRAIHNSFIDSFSKSSSTGRLMSQRSDIKGLHSNGETFPIEASISKIEIKGEVFFTAIIRDIADRIKMEQELQLSYDFLEQRVYKRTAELTHARDELLLSQKRLDDAQKMAHVGNWELNLETNELFWSDEIFSLFDIDKNKFDASYEAFLNAIHPDDRDAVNTAYTNSLETKESYAITHRLLMQNGEIKHVEEKCQSFYDDAGNAIRSIGTVQDITERVLAEEKISLAHNKLASLNEQLEARVKSRTAELELERDKAEEANLAKSQFLSQMSHELRTPMNAILGFSQLLKIAKLNPLQHQQVEEITVAGTHLLHLIEDLLDLSKIDSNHVNIIISKANATQIVNEALHFIEPDLHNKKINIQLNLEKINHILVFTDIIRLRQILINFLTNAIKYNKEDGDITIDACEVKHYLRIEVTDTGIGIEKNKLPLLFTPFERLGQEFSAIEGTGIGLALCKKLIDKMNGNIGVDSISGKGSTFWLEIPIAENKFKNNSIIDGDTQNTRKKPQLKRKIKLLYVEDNIPSIRLMESLYAENQQIELTTTSSGEHGIEIAKSILPDIIILDINLPDINGFQIMKILREDKMTHSIPCIALSADALPEDIHLGLEKGFYRYLTKPLDIELLEQALVDAIE